MSHEHVWIRFPFEDWDYCLCGDMRRRVVTTAGDDDKLAREHSNACSKMTGNAFAEPACPVCGNDKPLCICSPLQEKDLMTCRWTKDDLDTFLYLEDEHRHNWRVKIPGRWFCPIYECRICGERSRHYSSLMQYHVPAHFDQPPPWRRGEPQPKHLVMLSWEMQWWTRDNIIVKLVRALSFECRREMRTSLLRFLEEKLMEAGP